MPRQCAAYAQQGQSETASRVYEHMWDEDAVAWTVMITAYVEHGQAEDALQLKLYEHMRGEGISPTRRTFVSMLQACGMQAGIEEDVLLDGLSTKVKSFRGQVWKAVHADVRIQGCCLDVFIGSTVVRMYRKGGSIADAEEAFDGIVGAQ